MSRVSVAVPPSRIDEATAATTMKPAVEEGVMGSLRVIELQLVAFIMIFSASGLIPLLNLVFPAAAMAYLLALFLMVGKSGDQSQEIFQGSRLFRAYVIAGTTVGYFLPLAYVLGGFARGDDHAVPSMMPHLFLLLFQILTENIIRRMLLFSPPVKALVPLLYTVRRIFVIIDYIINIHHMKHYQYKYKALTSAMRIIIKLILTILNLRNSRACT
ncbi:transmembrane protein [Perilla frutescens var. frutescens]|nr:transmembrane protein [Perilla frutescens var. frutescens]